MDKILRFLNWFLTLLFRRISFFVLCTLYSVLSVAQSFPVQVIPQALPPAPIYVSNYADASTVTSPLRVQIILNDFEIANREIRLKTYFTGSGLSFQSNDIVVGASPLFLEGGIPLVLTNAELAPYFEFNNITGINANQYGNAIPEGAYQFCFEVYDVLTGSRLSNKSCAVSVVFQNEPPFLVLPRNKENVDEANPQYIVFQWTPRSINVSNVEYELSLVEIWDNQVDPQQAFLSSPPVFQTTTSTPTYVYGPSDPLLLSGKKYAWRVQAKAKQGTEEIGLFKNEGYSEIFSFSYAGACELPSGINHEVKGSTNANIFWDDFSTDIPKYTIRYRQKNSATSENEWFFSKTNSNNTTLWDLKAGGTYEYQLQNTCAVTESQWSIVKQFTTFISDDEDSVYDCNISPDFNITNRELLPNMGVGDKFTAGDFPITVQEVNGSNGRFNGKGYVTIPYLSSIKVGVQFTNIEVNTENQLIEGEVITMYDPTLSNILDIDEAIDTVNDVVDSVGEFFEGDNDLDEIQVDWTIGSKDEITIEDGMVVITNPYNGVTTKEPLGDDMIITDQEGNTYYVDPDGNITEGGQITPGEEVNPGNVSGVSNNGDLQSLTAENIIVKFNTKGTYGFDKMPATASAKLKNEYKTIKGVDGNDYVLAHHAVKNGGTTQIQATIEIQNNAYTPDQVVFKNKQGKIFTPTSINGNTATISLDGVYTFENETIYAVVPSKEDTSKQLTAGAFTLWHLAERSIDVAIVSVGASVGDVATAVNGIFGNGLAKINFKNPITLDVNTVQAALGANGMDVGESPLTAAYNEEQKALRALAKSAGANDSNTYYVIVLGSDFSNTKAIAGFMPLQRQFGFVFQKYASSGEEAKGDIAKTVAHEIGHGVFALQHPFSQYGSDMKNKTDWLMDYNGGTNLPHTHWSQMHDPAIRFYVFQDEEDGESVATTLKTISSINKDNDYFAFLTPNGKRIILPKGKVPIFYHGIENDKYNEIIPGVLIGFRDKAAPGQSVLSGTKHWAEFSGNVFTGYENFEYSKPSIQNDDNSILIGLPYGGNENINFLIHKFQKEIEDYRNEPDAILSISSDEFKNLGFFKQSNLPIKEDGDKRSAQRVLGEGQIDITAFELEILNGRFIDLGQFNNLTTLLPGVTNVSHDEKPESFIIVKIAEHYNRYPVLFKEYARWFDTWHMFQYFPEAGPLTENLRPLLDQIEQLYVSSRGGEWEQNNLKTEQLNNPNSPFNKWLNNLNAHNGELYDFYTSFLLGLQEYVKTGAQNNVICLQNLSSKSDSDIYNCVIRASEDELRRNDVLNYSDRILAIKSILKNFWNDDDNERAIVRLIEHTPSSFNSDSFISALETECNNLTIPKGKDSYETKTLCFWEILFESVDDSGFLFSGDNRKALMKALLKHYYKSNRYKEKTSDYLTSLQKLDIKTVEAQSFTFTNDYQSLYRRIWTELKTGASHGYYLDVDDIYSSIDTEILNTNRGSNSSEIRTEQKTKRGLFLSETSYSKDFSPFDLVTLVNLSNQDLLSDYSKKDINGKPRAIQVPALMLHYVSEVGNNETTKDVIQLTVDLASLVMPAGQLANLSNVGKFIYYSDKVSSVTSIAGEAFLGTENQELGEFFNKVSLATGVISMGELALGKKITQISKLDAISNSTNQIVQYTSDVVEDVINLNQNSKLSNLSSLQKETVIELLESDKRSFTKMGHLDDSGIARYDLALDALRQTDNAVDAATFVKNTKVKTWLNQLPAKFKKEVLSAYLRLNIETTTLAKIDENGVFKDIKWIDKWVGEKVPGVPELDDIVFEIKSIETNGNLHLIQETTDKIGFRYALYKTTHVDQPLWRTTYKNIQLTANPNKVTTIVGKWSYDTGPLIDELGPSHWNMFTGQQPRVNGKFNLLNIDLSGRNLTDQQIWEQINEPWLREAMENGDDIIIATDPVEFGFGFFKRELDFIQENAARYGYDFAEGVSVGKLVKLTKGVDDLLVNGAVPSVINKAFTDWFDNLTTDELNLLWNDSKIQGIIKDRIRHPGGLHEWCMVCETPKFKGWNVSMDEIKRFRTDIPDLTWTVPDDVPNIGGSLGGHGSTGSTTFHNELQKIISDSNSISEFNTGLNNLINRWDINPNLLPPLITN